jgi:hypothetical protein
MNKHKKVQECDATAAEKETTAGHQKKLLKTKYHVQQETVLTAVRLRTSGSNSSIIYLPIP